MALSILSCGGLSHGIYDSNTGKFIMTGSLPEMEDWKHRIEQKEQAEQNRIHFNELREKYITQLVAGGNTNEQAVIFLKQQMPFLFTT